MKKLLAATLLDVLPESILQDPKLKASAQALSAQLQAVTAATREVLHIPRLDELHGAVLDYVAEQLHIDFFEPLYLTEDEKRNLIRDSIAWHRIKGTPAAVEQIAHNAFCDAEVVEWFDYGGQPYHFKIRSHGFKETPDGWDTYTRMINVAKNVRSWIDNYELIIDGDEHKLNLFAGMVNTLTGSRTIEPARPPTNYRSQAFAGVANLLHGRETIGIAKPNTTFTNRNFVGQLVKLVGNVTIKSKTQPPDDDHDYRSWTSQTYAGTANLLYGRKVWSLARPKNPVTKLNAGIATVKAGRITINDTSKRDLGGKIIVHVGQALKIVGRITIKPNDTDWRELPVDGDWLGLRFRFPDATKRIITLPNPRDDLQKSEIRTVGDHAATNAIVLNSSGLATTGIDLAMLTTRTVRKIF